MADRFVAAARASRDAALELFEAARRPRSGAWEPTLIDTLHVEMVDEAGASLGSVVVDCRLRAARGRIDVVAPVAARSIGPIEVEQVLAFEDVMRVPTDAPPSRELLHLQGENRTVLVERDAAGVRSVRDLTDDERDRYIDPAAASVMDRMRADAIRADGIRSWGFTIQPIDEWKAQQAKTAQQTVVGYVAGLLLDGRYTASDPTQTLQTMRMRDKRIDAEQTIALPHQLGDVMLLAGDERGDSSERRVELKSRSRLVEIVSASEVEMIGTDGKVLKGRRVDLCLELTPDSEQQARIDKYGTRWATGLGVAVEQQSIAVNGGTQEALHAAAMELVSAYSMSTVRVLAAIGVAAHESPVGLVEASPKAIAPCLGLDYRAMARKDKDALSKHIALAQSICVQLFDPNDANSVKVSMPLLVREMTRIEGGKAVPMLKPSMVWGNPKNQNHVPREWLHLDPVQQAVEMRLIWSICQRYSRAIGRTVAQGSPTNGMRTALSHLLPGDLTLERLREGKGVPAVRRRLERAFEVAADMGVVIELIGAWKPDPLETQVTAMRSRRLFMAEDARRGEVLAAAAERVEKMKQLPPSDAKPKGRRRLKAVKALPPASRVLPRRSPADGSTDGLVVAVGLVGAGQRPRCPAARQQAGGR